jgi:hypothetical protein
MARFSCILPCAHLDRVRIFDTAAGLLRPAEGCRWLRRWWCPAAGEVTSPLFQGTKDHWHFICWPDLARENGF